MSFPARFFGKCAACGGKVAPSQQIEYDDANQLCHVDCEEAEFETEEQYVDRPLGDVCDKCFMEKSLSGDCACTR